MKRPTLCFLMLTFLALTACSLGGQSKPARFYELSPIAGAASVGTVGNGNLSVGIGPLQLPDILDRPQIVTREDAYRLALAEFDRWGGDLERNLLRVLSQNMMQRLGTNKVVTYPWQRRDTPDFQVSIRFFRFDGALGEEATLTGAWRIISDQQECPLTVQRFAISKAPSDDGYAALVDALSRGVADLSQSIADKLAASGRGC